MTEIEILKLRIAMLESDIEIYKYFSESLSVDVQNLKEKLKDSQLKINQAITVLSGVFNQNEKPSTMLQQIICEKEKINKAHEILKQKPEIINNHELLKGMN